MNLLNLIDAKNEVLILPLGGKNIISKNRSDELGVFTKITSFCYALIDLDGEDGSKEPEKGRNEFLDLCKKNSICAHMTAKRALENYFTDSALRKAFPHHPEIKPLKEFERLTEGKSKEDRHWNKPQNIRIAREMTLNDLHGTDILKFLKCVIAGENCKPSQGES